MKKEKAKRIFVKSVKEGDLINHSEYGKGKIVKIVGEGKKQKIIVKFTRYKKEKELSLSKEKFIIIESYN